MKHEFTKQKITKSIARECVGYYWLGWLDSNDNFVRKYIGRSDRCLQKRLLKQLYEKGGKYTHFQSFPTHSILEAFRKECAGYHYGIEIDNIIHPDAPNGLSYACQYCLSIPIGHDRAPAISQEVGV